MTGTAPNSPPASDPGRSQPLDWGHATDEVHAGGLDIKRAATAADRAALAQALNILDCELLELSYRLKRAPADGYRLKGKLKAEVVQACVVTLAPVHDTVRIDLDVEFRPAEEVAAVDGGAVDLDDETEIEPIDGKWLAVGRIVFEELAAGLNPYPRRPGAEFSPQDDGQATVDTGKPNPFAVLAKLKQQPTDKA